MASSQRDLLRQYGIRPVKRRGQNFLIDGNLARWIAARVLELGSDVLEMGAGAGALTVPLLQRGARLTAVEVDRRLCALLRTELAAEPRFVLLEEDLAKLDWAAALQAAGDRPVVAGNLPYVLTSTVLFCLAEQRERLTGAVLMVQKEVAERLTAACGERAYGVLAALLGPLFAIEILRSVPAAVFWPRPEVSSAIVRLRPVASWPQSEYVLFRRAVKSLFGQRRKKIGSLLRAQHKLSAAEARDLARQAGMDPDARPEQVPPAAFHALALALAARGIW